MGNKPSSKRKKPNYKFVTHLSTLEKPLCGDSIQFVQYPCYNNNNDDNYHHKILIFGGYKENDTILKEIKIFQNHDDNNENNNSVNVLSFNETYHKKNADLKYGTPLTSGNGIISFMIKNRFIIVIEVIQYGIYNVYDIKQDKWLLLSKQSSESKTFFFYYKHKVRILDALLITNSLLIIASNGNQIGGSYYSTLYYYNLSDLLHPKYIGHYSLNHLISKSTPVHNRLCLLSYYQRDHEYKDTEDTDDDSNISSTEMLMQVHHRVVFAMILSGYEQAKPFFSPHRVVLTIDEIKNKNTYSGIPTNNNHNSNHNASTQSTNNNNNNNGSTFRNINTSTSKLNVNNIDSGPIEAKIGLFFLRNKLNHHIIVSLGGVRLNKEGPQESVIEKMCDWIMIANLHIRKKDYLPSALPLTNMDEEKTACNWALPSIMLRGHKCHIVSGKTYMCIDLPSLIDNYKNYGFNHPKDISWKCRRIIWIGYLKNQKNKLCKFNKVPKDIVQYILSFLIVL